MRTHPWKHLSKLLFVATTVAAIGLSDTDRPAGAGEEECPLVCNGLIPALDISVRVGTEGYVRFRSDPCSDAQHKYRWTIYADDTLRFTIQAQGSGSSSIALPHLCTETGVHEYRAEFEVASLADTLCKKVFRDTALVHCVCVPMSVETVPQPDRQGFVGETVDAKFEIARSETVDWITSVPVIYLNGAEYFAIGTIGVGPESGTKFTIPHACDEPGLFEYVLVDSEWVAGDSARVCPTVLSDTVYVECRSPEACPRTRGFWKQQCDQRGNGSTKVCRAGMEALFRCVIEETGVTHWVDNDGLPVETAALAALPDTALFAALCAELEGPRPMTQRHMAEAQYLTLSLNVCSGALPPYIEYDGAFQGTVGDALASLEAALNGGNDLGFWKDVADDINNRIGVLAKDCPDGDALFRNLSPCDGSSSPDVVAAAAPGPVLVSADPNPISGGPVTLRFRFADVPDGDVEIGIFDIAGRRVRAFRSAGAGDGAVTWDLRDERGAPVPPGLFFYRVQAGERTGTGKVMVLAR